MTNTVLNIKDIQCGYGPHTVLHGVNLSVEKKELVGLIGPNGSGKTTLLRAITKIIPFKKGWILFKGISVKNITHRNMAKKIAVVSQAHEETFFKMTVNEVVTLGRIPHINKYQLFVTKKDAAEVEKSMSMVDVLHLREREIGCLSGGERQRVLLARALAQEPELLLLDEPTTHLDINHQVRILDLIRGLNKEYGLTVIMVLHDLNLASEYCHRLALLNEGRVYKIGPPEEVIDYETIERVYKTRVIIQKNPVSSRPHIFVVSEEEMQKERREFD